MKHVARNRCGYSGYICNGITDISDEINRHVLVGDSVMDRVSDFDQSTATTPFNWIDNFLNVPVRFRGFVTAWSPIYDMYSDLLKITASECDPYGNNYLDLLNNVYAAIVDARSFGGYTATYVKMASAVIVFPLGNGVTAKAGTDGIFEPGVLEPVTPTHAPDPTPVPPIPPNPPDPPQPTPIPSSYYFSYYFSYYDSKFSSVESRITSLTSITSEFSRIISNFSSRFTSINNSFTSINNSFTSINDSFASINNSFTSINNSFDSITSAINNITSGSNGVLIRNNNKIETIETALCEE